jgi:Tfp pilus assembly protein FimV
MTVGIALLVIVGGVLFASRAQANEVQGASTPQYVIAQEGDTLWRIAEQVAPNAPVSEVVDALVQLNGTSLRVGQVVLIP